MAEGKRYTMQVDGRLLCLLLGVVIGSHFDSLIQILLTVLTVGLAVTAVMLVLMAFSESSPPRRKSTPPPPDDTPPPAADATEGTGVSLSKPTEGPGPP